MTTRLSLLHVTLFGFACKPTTDPGDVRPEAQMVLQAALEADDVLTVADVFDLPSDVPETIRVWRSAQTTGTSSCDGTVEEIDLETYVKGVLPAEWVASWDDEALQAGAIAARTYAAFWVTVGGKYGCADVDDGTWTQVYRDHHEDRTDAAVDATEGVVIRRNGSLVFAEYSAENGPLTRFEVPDAVCQGERRHGHGKGMCQWGTQRWAEAGKDATWMVEHYYPGARAVWPDEQLIDGLALTVRAGDRFELSLSVTNRSAQVWKRGAVGVGTEPSAFQAHRWRSSTRPAVSKRRIEPDQRARVSWMMRAPQVSEATLFPEFFYLDGPATDRPGSAGTFNITVLPSPSASQPQAPAKWSWWWAIGLAAAGLLGSIAYRHRRG